MPSILNIFNQVKEYSGMRTVQGQNIFELKIKEISKLKK